MVRFLLFLMLCLLTVLQVYIVESQLDNKQVYYVFIIFRSVVCYKALNRLAINQQVHIDKLQQHSGRNWHPILNFKKCYYYFYLKFFLVGGYKYFSGWGREWAPWWSECKDVLAASHSLSLLSRMSAFVSILLFAAGCNNSSVHISTCIVLWM